MSGRAGIAKTYVDTRTSLIIKRIYDILMLSLTLPTPETPYGMQGTNCTFSFDF